MSEYPEYTTPSSQPSSGWVTITHPFHPLRGQQVEIVSIRRGSDPDLIVRLPTGLHAAVAMGSTDYAAPPDVDPLPGPPPLLDVNGLRQVVQFIDHLHQERRYPIEVNANESCPPGDTGYDQAAQLLTDD